MFLTISIIFQFLLVSYFEKFYLTCHSIDNPQQNVATFVSLMNVGSPHVLQQKFELLLYEWGHHLYVEIHPEVESAGPSSIVNKFQNILIMLVGRQDTNDALFLNVFLRIFTLFMPTLVFSCGQASTKVISCRATFVILNTGYLIRCVQKLLVSLLSVASVVLNDDNLVI